MLALWLAAMLVAVALELPARFAAGQDPDRTTFLPSSAESTRAIERERASGDERTPLVIVYQRDGGLTAADVAGATDDVARLQAAERARPAIYRGLVTAADWRPTLRGEGFMLRADVRTPPEAEALNALVADIRATVHRGGRDGLRVAVTGPAATVADAERVFEQVDVRLYAGALALVMLLLVLVYRSPVFLWLPLAAVGAAELMTQSLGWVLVEAGVPVTDQASAIVSVLVLGVGTDYALLIVARYRELLRDESDHRAALADAIRAAAPAVVASGAVVIVALLCLVLADVPSTRGLGPIGALGVAVSVVAMLTLLPALLALAGRRALWRPRLGVRAADAGSVQGAWQRLGERIARRPRPVWLMSCAALVAMCAGWLSLDTGLTQVQAFRTSVESVEGQRIVAAIFGPSAAAPTTVSVPAARANAVGTVELALRDVPGVGDGGAGRCLRRRPDAAGPARARPVLAGGLCARPAPARCGQGGGRAGRAGRRRHGDRGRPARGGGT